MRAVVQSVLALILLVGLAGCDVFGPSTESLAFRPLLNSDTFVTGEPEVPPPGTIRSLSPSRSRVLVFRDTSEVFAFGLTYTVSEPFPEVDFATESIVGYFLRDNRGDAFVDIQEIKLRGGDELRLLSDFGGVGVSPNNPASRFVVQLVAVPRLAEPITSYESRATD